MKDFFKCQECVELLTDYLEGNLDRDIKSRLDEHLSGCAPCINFVRSFEKSTTMTQRLKEQQVDFGIMAIENSLAGSILPNYKLLKDSRMKIIGEIYLRIKQNLVALSGQAIGDIREVYSHLSDTP